MLCINKFQTPCFWRWKQTVTIEAILCCVKHSEKCNWTKCSHANKGHLHFGGIYWLRCYTNGCQESDLTEINKLHSQAISASIGLLSGKYEASVEGNVSRLKENIVGSFSEALMLQTTVKVTKNGGPHVSNIPLWKSGLVASNLTWNVIDCGSNTVPVWEIIQVHICLNDV